MSPFTMFPLLRIATRVRPHRVIRKYSWDPNLRAKLLMIGPQYGEEQNPENPAQELTKKGEAIALWASPCRFRG
jgi:hypothetical protein